MGRIAKLKRLLSEVEIPNPSGGFIQALTTAYGSDNGRIYGSVGHAVPEDRDEKEADSSINRGLFVEFSTD